jgi:hypothetical protein
MQLSQEQILIQILLLSQGLKYNLHYKKYWIQTCGLEAKTAITNLDITEQYYRHVVAKKTKESPNK